MKTLADYNTKDSKNDCIIQKPCKIAVSDTISIKTLTGMDNIMENFKFKNVSQIIDLSDFNWAKFTEYPLYISTC